VKAWIYPILCVVAPAAWSIALSRVWAVLERRRARREHVDYSI
jgi:hypothetical protein